MSSTVFSIILTIPMVLQLVVGVLGLIFSNKARPSGVPGLLMAGFVVMIASMVLSVAWQFITLKSLDWGFAGYLGVDVPLGLIEAIAWLLVALGVRKMIRGNRQPAQYPGPGGYPMPGQPGPVSQQPGYPQPGPAPAGPAQPGYAQPGYYQPGAAPQPGYPQPGYPQPGPAQPGYPQPGYPQQPPGPIGG